MSAGDSLVPKLQCSKVLILDLLRSDQCGRDTQQSTQVFDDDASTIIVFPMLDKVSWRGASVWRSLAPDNDEGDAGFTPGWAGRQAGRQWENYIFNLIWSREGTSEDLVQSSPACQAEDYRHWWRPNGRRCSLQRIPAQRNIG